MKDKITKYCFSNLHHFLKNGKMLEYPAEFDSHMYPLFVTWQKDGDLRGCIGTFADDQKLGETLQRYSLIAAVQDTRFPPIDESEFPQLRVEVSLLSNFEKIEDPLDWKIGQHGIEIEFKKPDMSGRPMRGTFLPNVAPEQGWTSQAETLEHLVAKAGWHGGLKAVMNSFTEVKRYESIKFGLDYKTYQAQMQ